VVEFYGDGGRSIPAGGEHLPHAHARAVRRSPHADAQRACSGRGDRRGANL